MRNLSFIILFVLIFFSVSQVFGSFDISPLVWECLIINQNIKIQNKTRIRKINYVIDNVYISKDEKPVNFPYSTINSLHFKTKLQVIKREILFNEGDVFNEKLIAETERNLRRLGIFRKVIITSKKVSNSLRDVTIRTIDAWTTKIIFNVSRVGGEYNGSIGFREDNLIGYDKDFTFYYSNEAEKKAYHLRYYDPRFLGSNVSTQALYTKSADYEQSSFHLWQPFRSTKSRNSYSVYFFKWQGIRELYQAGVTKFTFNQKRNFCEIYTGFSPNSNLSWIFRQKFGYRYKEDIFENDSNSILLPATFINEKNSGFFWNIEYEKEDYIKEYNINTYGRDEDFNMGYHFIMNISYRPEFLGSAGTSTYLSGRISKGFSFNAGNFILASANWAGRYQNNRLENGYLYAYSNYFLRIHYRITLASHIETTFFHKPDADVQYVIGGAEGLTGYKLNYFTGNKGMLFNIESRVLLFDDLLKLLTIGAVFFYDAGNAYNIKTPIILSELNSDVGCGLRITFPRSSSGSVLRLVYSYSFNENGLDNRWLFSFSTSNVFL